MDTALQGNEHRERPGPLSSERQPWTSSERPLTSSLHTSEQQLTSSLNTMVDILREQLQAAQERERDYREHIARLTTMLDQAHQQNQRLLDMPRTPIPSTTAQDAPGALQPAFRYQRRNFIRWTIIAHTQRNPTEQCECGIWLARSIEKKDVTGGYNSQCGTGMLHSIIAQDLVKDNFSGA